MADSLFPDGRDVPDWLLQVQKNTLTSAPKAPTAPKPKAPVFGAGDGLPAPRSYGVGIAEPMPASAGPKLGASSVAASDQLNRAFGVEGVSGVALNNVGASVLPRINARDQALRVSEQLSQAVFPGPRPTQPVPGAPADYASLQSRLDLPGGPAGGDIPRASRLDDSNPNWKYADEAGRAELRALAGKPFVFPPAQAETSLPTTREPAAETPATPATPAAPIATKDVTAAAPAAGYRSRVRRSIATIASGA